MNGTEWVYELVNKMTAPLAGIQKDLSATDKAAHTTEKSLQGLSNLGTTDFGFNVDGFNRGLEKASEETGILGGTLTKVGGIAAGIFAAHEIMEYGAEVYETGKHLETLNNVISYTAKDTADAAENHKFLQQIIEDYKLPLVETTDGFSQFSASLMGTALQGQKARDIFEGVSIGTTAMHLSAAQSSQVFNALNQMMSKGTVQAQELKLQLGNALPGAARIAAQAMGMTDAAFGKAMESGQIMAADFLPKFAAKLKEIYAGAIPMAIESTIAKETEYTNKSLELKKRVFEKMQPLINSYYDLGVVVLPKVADAFDWIAEKAEGFIAVIEAIPDIIEQNKDILTGLGIILGGVTGALILMNAQAIISAGEWAVLGGVWMAVEGIEAGIALATNAWTAAQIALNVAMTANPIGLIIAGLTVLAGAIYIAWQRSETFRGVIYGIGSAIMEIWEIIKDWASSVIDLFTNIAGLIEGIFTLDYDKIKSSAEGAFEAFKSAYAPANMLDYGKRLGNAFSDGFDEGAADVALNKASHQGASKSKVGAVSIGGDDSFQIAGIGGSADGGGSTAPKSVVTASNASGISGDKNSTSGKIINVRIENLVRDLKILPQQLKESAPDIQKFLNETLTSAVRDFEIGMSNGD